MEDRSCCWCCTVPVVRAQGSSLVLVFLCHGRLLDIHRSSFMFLDGRAAGSGGAAAEASDRNDNKTPTSWSFGDDRLGPSIEVHLCSLTVVQALGARQPTAWGHPTETTTKHPRHFSIVLLPIFRRMTMVRVVRPRIQELVAATATATATASQT